MKLVVQRVSNGKVTKKETQQVVGIINKGLLVLFGVKEGDTKSEVDYLAEKLVKMRVMADENDKMNLSIFDTTKEILVVSQFTLYANTKDGNRPSFIQAAKPKEALQMYEYFIQRLRDLGVKVQTGSFGDYMEIEACLDGPVTIVIES